MAAKALPMNKVELTRSTELELAEWFDDTTIAQQLVDSSTELVQTDASIEAMKRALATLQAQRTAIATKRDLLKEVLVSRNIADGTRIRVNGGQVRFVPGYTRAAKNNSDVGQIIVPTIRVDLTRTELFPMRAPLPTSAAPSSDIAPVSKAPTTQPSSGVRITK